MYNVCAFMILRMLVTLLEMLVLLLFLSTSICVGLYNVAHETTRGSMDTHFPRLGQMIIDYDAPIRKMTEEFIPLSKVINQLL